jgi:hypothetical protein
MADGSVRHHGDVSTGFGRRRKWREEEDELTVWLRQAADGLVAAAGAGESPECHGDQRRGRGSSGSCSGSGLDLRTPVEGDEAG